MTSAGSGSADAHDSRIAPQAQPKGSRASRYGNGPGTARAHGESGEKNSNLTGKLLVLLMVAVVLVTGIYAVRYVIQQREINARMTYVSQEVIDDNTLRVWVDVTRNRPDEPSYCIVQAYNYSKAEVGRRDIPLAPDGVETMRLAVDIPTNHRAVSGEIYGCSSDVPAYLDTDNPEYAEAYADS